MRIFRAGVIDAMRSQPDRIDELLENLSQQQMERLYYDYRMATAELYPDYVDEERGLRDEDINVASSWVVAQGKDKYLAVWDNPSLLPDPDTVPEIDYSGDVALAYHQRYGKWLVG